MGVPKFFLYISDRYPSINNAVKEYEIPQYDNLYLDMNSIIHTCSHPSDFDVHFRIGKEEFSDDDIYQNVSRYVEIVFRIVKPLNVMFLAFDGVAPRAKMNQQRGHRFRVARCIDENLIHGGVPQSKGLFDANCITTGTVFMAEMIDYLKHFVAYKISTDPLWQKCKIILSGSEVPGEGEHKIMEFIRYNKAQPNYNPNTRHCLYSLDADLIILGLCTHEPHFSLLREKVTFGKTKIMVTPEESDFLLLHLSLVREYLQYELTPVKKNLKFEFDLEKIIDDWVLLGFLVGNDFIPQLPNLNIVHGALPLLYKVYIEVLPTLNGYINENGVLNVNRFEKLIQQLSRVQNKISSVHGSIDSYDISVSQIENNELPSDNLIELHSIAKSQINNDILPIETKSKSSETAIEKVRNVFKMLRMRSNSNENVDIEESKTSSNVNSKDEEFITSEPNCSETESNRVTYYKTKFHFDRIDDAILQPLVKEYVRAIQWTLSYYFHGCCSWSWFYPYHYAPFISDIKGLNSLNLKFDIGEPFSPLQHLLAVLPTANAHLLPPSLRSLVTDQNSPIIHFYPQDFLVDLNGKSNDWEAVVLIPFIDENILIKAMEQRLPLLNAKERKRNISGSTCIFKYTKTNLGQYPVDTVFDSFINHAELQHVKPGDWHVPKQKLLKGLCPDVSFEPGFPGFPTLKYIDHTFGFGFAESKYLNNIVKKERIILNVSSKPIPHLKEIAEILLGHTVYIGWPYIREAHVIGVSDLKEKIFLKNFWKGYDAENLKVDKLSNSAISSIEDEIKVIKNTYEQCHGINIGETKVIVHVFPKNGRRYAILNGGRVQVQTKWSTLSVKIPFQLIIQDKKIVRVDFVLYKSITDIFGNASSCFMLGHPHYGSKGEVRRIITRQQHVAVALQVTIEPDFTSKTDQLLSKETELDYMSSSTVAKKLNLSPVLINRITGSFILSDASNASTSSNPKYHDIGLHLKIPKRDKEMIGYTRRIDSSWKYSGKAVQLIQDYLEKFPELFQYINKTPKSSTFAVSDVFSNGLDDLQSVKTWLSHQETTYTTFMECGTTTVGLEGVPKIENILNDFLPKQEFKTVETQVSSQLIFKPGTIEGLVPPDAKAQHKLLDRIVCVRENFTVPSGLKGTIIGIQEKEDKWKNVYEVLFDSPFTGGLTLYNSSEHRCYRLTVADFLNITFGHRNNNPKQVNPADRSMKNTNKNQLDNKTNTPRIHNDVVERPRKPNNRLDKPKKLNDGVQRPKKLNKVETNNTNEGQNKLNIEAGESSKDNIEKSKITKIRLDRHPEGNKAKPMQSKRRYDPKNKNNENKNKNESRKKNPKKFSRKENDSNNQSHSATNDSKNQP